MILVLSNLIDSTCVHVTFPSTLFYIPNLDQMDGFCLGAYSCPNQQTREGVPRKTNSASRIKRPTLSSPSILAPANAQLT